MSRDVRVAISRRGTTRPSHLVPIVKGACRTSNRFTRFLLKVLLPYWRRPLEPTVRECGGPRLPRMTLSDRRSASTNQPHIGKKVSDFFAV